MDMKSHLVLLPRVTLLDKELVQWKTESENIYSSIAIITFLLSKYIDKSLVFTSLTLGPNH